MIFFIYYPTVFCWNHFCSIFSYKTRMDCGIVKDVFHEQFYIVEIGSLNQTFEDEKGSSVRFRHGPATVIGESAQ
jgi:hypothetical protein